jgi:hypothetical protein
MGLFASFRHYNDFSANKSAYGEGYKPVQLIRKPEGDFKGKRLGRGGEGECLGGHKDTGYDHMHSTGHVYIIMYKKGKCKDFFWNGKGFVPPVLRREYILL